MRSQFLHLIDVMPTVLDAMKIKMPQYVNGVKQEPLNGRSFLSTFTNADAPAIRDTQYFEVFGNRAIYENGWVAAIQHTLPWRQDVAPGFDFDNEKWELYNIDKDFSEADNVAAKYPEKVDHLKKLFYEEAEKYHVYPLDDRGAGRLIVPKPSPLGNRTKFTYYEGATRIPETAAPNTKNRSWTMETVVATDKNHKDGVINAMGGSSAGYALYIKNGYPTFVYNYFESDVTFVKSSKKLPDGLVSVKIDFKYDGGGPGKGGLFTLYINNEKVGQAKITHSVAGRFGIDTFGIGEDDGSPVTRDYTAPFKFKGGIEEVNIELK